MFIYNIKNTKATFSHNTTYNIILILIILILIDISSKKKINKRENLFQMSSCIHIIHLHSKLNLNIQIKA